MVFSSLPFFYAFLPVVLILCLIVPKKAKNYVLLAANLIFYAYGEPVYVLLMLASIVVNYAFALMIERFTAKKQLLIIAIILNLAGLVIFKYMGLITGTLRLIPGLDFIPLVELALPIGISFYTFQAMSYVVDVYRGECAAERNFVGFAAYISLFPQLIAGPIVRYTDVREQISREKESSLSVSMGVRLFTVGLAKKVLLANQLGILWNAVSADVASAGTLAAWLGIIAYSLQLYFDFSGYSDMARGLGALLGFDFCINFNYPYISKSITEFWHRWHISLSTWFRDYVYFPLGGSRCSVPRMCFNLIITWLLTGLWHGAGWNFLAWGVYYGALLIIEKLFLGKYLRKLPDIFQHVYTLLIVMIGWIFFASESFGAAIEYLGVMFSLTPGSVLGGAASWLPILLIACVAATPVGSGLWKKLEEKRLSVAPEAVLCAVALILCTASLVSSSYNPFLYFRF